MIKTNSENWYIIFLAPQQIEMHDSYFYWEETVDQLLMFMTDAASKILHKELHQQETLMSKKNLNLKAK